MTQQITATTELEKLWISTTNITDGEGELVNIEIPKITDYDYQFDDPYEPFYIDKDNGYVETMMKVCPPPEKPLERRMWINWVGSQYAAQMKGLEGGKDSGYHPDKYNNGDGGDPKRKHAPNDQVKDKTKKSAYDLWMSGQVYFEQFHGKKEKGNFQIAITQQNHWGGLEFGMRADILPIPGMQHIPETAARFKNIHVTSQQVVRVINMMPDDVREFWMDLLCGLDSYKTRISKFAIPLAPRDNQNSLVVSQKSISIDGALAWKSIPPMEWFDKEIREINVLKDLLAIFPEAEANSLLLHLGRIALGAPSNPLEKTPLIEFDPKFAYRTLGIINGEPGVGKSSLWQFFISGFQKCGYEVKAFQSTINQFGWDKVRADLLIADDTSAKSLTDMLNSGNFKSAITGGVEMENQRKGVDGTPIISRCAVVVMANEVKINKIDPGMLDRCHIWNTLDKDMVLHNYMQEGENQETHNSRLTRQRWSYLAEKYDTSTDVLALYCIRCGLNMLLEKIGYSKQDDGTWVQSQEFKFRHTSPLESQFNENRSKYTFRFPPNVKKLMVECARKCITLNDAVGDLTGHSKHYEYDEGFNVFQLHLVAEMVHHLTEMIKLTDTAIHKHRNDEVMRQREQEYKNFYHALLMWILPKESFQVSTLRQFQIAFNKQYSYIPNADGGDFDQPQEEMWNKYINYFVTAQGYAADKERLYYAEIFHSTKQRSHVFERELENILSQFKMTKDNLVDVSRKYVWLCEGFASLESLEAV